MSSSSPAPPPGSLPNLSQRDLLSPSPSPGPYPPTHTAPAAAAAAFNPPLEGARSGPPPPPPLLTDGDDDDNAGRRGSPARSALDELRRRDGGKVIVLFKAIGSAPLMRQNQFKVTANYPFQFVVNHLRKTLGSKPTDPLFLYINNSFAPSPDDPILNLYKCFKSGNQLIVNYSTTQAWG